MEETWEGGLLIHPAVKLVWPGKNNPGLYIMRISSLKASCWETGIWKNYMGKMIPFLLSYLPPRTTRNTHKKQGAGNPSQAGSKDMLFKHLLLQFPSDSQVRALFREKWLFKSLKLWWGKRKMVTGLALSPVKTVVKWLECSLRKQKSVCTYPTHPEAVKNLISYLSSRKVLSAPDYLWSWLEAVPTLPT